jgi:hypothetical protein
VQRYQLLEPADDLAAGAEVDACRHDVLEQAEPYLLQPGAVRRRPVADLQQRFPVEERQALGRLLQRRRGIPRPGGGRRPRR